MILRKQAICYYYYFSQSYYQEWVSNMLKGLYFKLHDDNDKEKDIIDFFNDEAKRQGISKMELMHILIKCYRIANKLK